MKCKNDKRRNLSIWGITFGCDDCHYSLVGVSFDSLTKEELNQVKKECDYYLKQKEVGGYE